MSAGARPLRPWTVLLGLLMGAGCAGSEVAPAVPPDTLRRTLDRAEVVAWLDDHRPIVEARIDGQPARLLFSTGTAESTVDEAFAASIGLVGDRADVVVGRTVLHAGSLRRAPLEEGIDAILGFGSMRSHLFVLRHGRGLWAFSSDADTPSVLAALAPDQRWLPLPFAVRDGVPVSSYEAPPVLPVGDSIGFHPTDVPGVSVDLVIDTGVAEELMLPAFAMRGVRASPDGGDRLEILSVGPFARRDVRVTRSDGEARIGYGLFGATPIAIDAAAERLWVLDPAGSDPPSSMR